MESKIYPTVAQTVRTAREALSLNQDELGEMIFTKRPAGVRCTSGAMRVLCNKIEQPGKRPPREKTGRKTAKNGDWRYKALAEVLRLDVGAFTALIEKEQKEEGGHVPAVLMLAMWKAWIASEPDSQLEGDLHNALINGGVPDPKIPASKFREFARLAYKISGSFNENQRVAAATFCYKLAAKQPS